MEKELKNSIDFINKKAGKTSGFSVPSNYFDELDDTIIAKIATSNFSDETGFKTPDDYFLNLEDRILESVSKEQKQSKVINFKARIFKAIPYLAAASIALFITFNSLIFKNTSSFTLDSISENDIENWLEFNTFNTNDIATVLGDDFLNMNDLSFAQLKTENLEDYLYSIDSETLLIEKD